MQIRMYTHDYQNRVLKTYEFMFP